MTLFQPILRAGAHCATLLVRLVFFCAPAGLIGLSAATGYAADYTFTIAVKAGDTIDGKTLIGWTKPAINDSDTVAFVGTFLTDMGFSSGIFTQSKLLVQKGDTIGGQTLTGMQAPVINNRGTV